MDFLTNGNTSQIKNMQVFRRYMLKEFLSGQVESMQEEMAGMMNNSVNIKRLQTDIEKLLKDVETLKDKIRASNGYKSEGVN